MVVTRKVDPAIRRANKVKNWGMGSSRRRARHKNLPRENFTSVEIFERDQWICQMCGVKTSKAGGYPSDRYPTIDHIIPISKHGGHLRTNVQCACWKCNSTKRANTAGKQLRLVA